MKKFTTIINHLEAAMSDVDTIIDELSKADRPKAATTVRNIADTCVLLLTERPITLPTAQAIHERGKMSIPNFPSERTIWNSYSRVATIYRECYSNIITRNKSSSTSGGRILTKEDLNRPLDIGTKRLIEQMIVLYREQSLVIKQLRSIIADEVKIPHTDIAGPTGVDPLLSSLLAEWLVDIRNNKIKLKADDIGLRATREAGPLPRIMAIELFKALEDLARKSDRRLVL